MLVKLVKYLVISSYYLMLLQTFEMRE